MIRLIVTIIGLAVAANAAWAEKQTCNTTTMQASTPTTDFIINTDGTVVHKTTGLMWKACPEGYNYAAGKCKLISGASASFEWADALKQVNTLNSADGFAGKQDWRLPNIKELASIVEVSCKNPQFNIEVFPGNAEDDVFWSASPDPANAANAMALTSARGISMVEKNTSRKVILVRTIQ